MFLGSTAASAVCVVSAVAEEVVAAVIAVVVHKDWWNPAEQNTEFVEPHTT